MRILIIEDELLASEFLQKMITDNLEDCQIVATAQNVKEAVKLYHIHKPDILLMDINLGDHCSFELFDYIDQSEVQVIFTSGYHEFALKAIKANAVDYLMKPVNIDELHLAVSKAKERIRLNEVNKQSAFSNLEDEDFSGMLLVWEADKLVPVKLDDIIKIKADGPYSKLYLTNGRILHTSKSLGIYDLMLKEIGFIRIHHSCLMNPLHLLAYTPGIRAFVTLSDKRIEYVARNKKRHLLKVMRIALDKRNNKSKE